MSSVASKENLTKVEEAHRFLIVLNQLSMPMMLRNMAAIREATPPEGVEFTDREKKFLDTFRDCPDPRIDLHQQEIAKIGWGRMETIFAQLRQELAACGGADAENAEKSAVKKILAWNKEHGAYSDIIPEETRNSDALADFHFFCEVYSARESEPAFTTAMRKFIFKGPLNSAEEKIIEDRDGLVDKWVGGLCAIGLDVVAFPLSQAFFCIEHGRREQNIIYKNVHDRIQPAQKNIDDLLLYVDRARVHLEAAVPVYRDLSDTEKALSSEDIARLEGFARDFASNISKWQANYNSKQFPKMLELRKAAERFPTTDQKDWAIRCWNGMPFALGADDIIPLLAKELSAALEPVSEEVMVNGGKQTFTPKSEAFFKLLMQLMAIKERFLTQEIKLEGCQRIAEAAEKGMVLQRVEEVDSDKTIAVTPKMKAFANDVRDFAQEVAVGFGNINAPTTPHTMRQRINGIVEEMKIGEFDRDRINAQRMIEQLELVGTYFREYVPVISTATNTLSSVRRTGLKDRAATAPISSQP